MVPTARRPALSLIAAVARNGAIGKDNGLLWHEPEDQRHFRRVTFGHPVIMGRKTWDSLPQRFRPLPGRRNIVITANFAWSADGAETAGSIDAARDLLAATDTAFVIGGAQIYRLALPLADELVLTEIDADLEGDIFFPDWNRADFEATSDQALVGRDEIAFRFVTYRRLR